MLRLTAGLRIVSGVVLAICVPAAISRADEPPATQPSTTSPAPPQSESTRDNATGTSAIVSSRTTLLPPRPAPLIEIGNPFFGPGNITHSIELPTGAVWTPTFIVFGTYRTAFQAFHDPTAQPGTRARGYFDQTRSEWANRLDIFGNLQLSGTERVLVGFRPLDNGAFARPGKAKYTGYQFTPDSGEGWVTKFNAQPTTLFFEGDFGQIFPKLDPYDSKQLDIGFSVGRQPLLYQDGLLIDDDLDAVGITRNTLLPHGVSNAQLSAIYAWDQINRGDGINHNDHALVGLFLNTDFADTTWDLDFAFVDGKGADPDGIYGGLSATRRFGELNTTFRILGSRALGRAPGANSIFSEFGNGSTAVGSGVLLFNELSYTIPATSDLLYLDSFWGIDRFTSAARGPDRGGSLGRVGILFAEQPIGRYGSALNSSPERAVGFALGYQKFFDADHRRQLILELGGREGTRQPHAGAAATGARYQQAFGQHFVLQLDGFVALNEGRGLGSGGRVEVRYEF